MSNNITLDKLEKETDFRIEYLFYIRLAATHLQDILWEILNLDHNNKSARKRRDKLKEWCGEKKEWWFVEADGTKRNKLEAIYSNNARNNQTVDILQNHFERFFETVRQNKFNETEKVASFGIKKKTGCWIRVKSQSA